MKKTPLLIAAAFCISTTAFTQSGTALHLQKGQKFQVENKIETTSSTTVQGQAMDSKANITSTYNIEVKDKVNDNYNLSNTISHILMNMEMMGQSINFDSDKQDDMNGMVGESLKDYINKPQDVQMDYSGKIISDPKDTSKASAIAKQLNFAQSGYGTQMAFLATPKNAKVGTSWTTKTDAGGIESTNNYTIKEINGDVATVSLEGTVATNMTMQQNGMDVVTKTSGKMSGEEKVNIKTGVIQTSTTTGDASGTVSAMGQDFPSSTKISSTTTIKAL